METLYPIGIQNFEKIRKEGYLYIDKTALVYRLAKTGSYYFLSRPRRFGKSLLISTLEAYFQGKKELFEGLAMERLEKDWVKYPILHLDLNISQYSSQKDLEDILNRNLVAWENLYGADPAERSLALRFAGIIQRACEKTGQRVVILVDEYDKPLLQNLHDEAMQTELRNMLKPFYGVLKTMDRYVEICGITEEEIHTYLEKELQGLASRQKVSYEEMCLELKKRYDGYHFVENSIGMYNPFSLLNTFAKKKLSDYWFETGTPSYLVELLKRTDYNLYDMAHTQTNADVLNSIDIVSRNPIPVIYQSGYLTIKEYDPEFQIYTLGFPNQEVEEGFVRYLLPYYSSITAVDSTFEIQKFIKEIRMGDAEAFFARLQSFFADTPYELIRNLEVHYQNVLFIVFKLVGFYVKTEYHTSRGRIDLVLQTDRYIYIMEFKLNGTAEEALQQIEDKQYALPFASDTRTLFRIGVNFSNETRNIGTWKIQTT